MSDLLQNLNKNPLTGWLVKALGLPNPVTLAREGGPYQAQPFKGKRALLLSTANGYLESTLRQILGTAGAEIHDAEPQSAEARFDILVMDATGLKTTAEYNSLYERLHPVARRISTNGRVLLLAPLATEADGVEAAAVARGLEGFCRSLGKELGPRGITVNLANVAQDAGDRLDMVLRFFCGPQTAYVSGQVVTVTAQTRTPSELPQEQLLAGKAALVTGAARGIGLATAQRLRQEGAAVICLDIPAAAEELEKVTGEMGAVPLALDISTADAPQKLVQFVRDQFGGLDILVHNAGITRDKTLGKMPEHFWQQVMQVNLAAIITADAALLDAQLIRDCARLVYLSSMSGVAGNFGQTNYATTKAALIGYVAAQGPRLAERGICANAVAPGFIETAMTDAMPFFTREAGRRLNSLKQGGQPRDVAELVCFLASPGTFGINGNTIRVCGQGLIGA